MSGWKNSIKSYIKDRKGQADNKLKAEYYKVNENITADCKEWIFYLPNQVLSFGFFQFFLGKFIDIFPASESLCQDIVKNIAINAQTIGGEGGNKVIFNTLNRPNCLSFFDKKL